MDSFVFSSFNLFSLLLFLPFIAASLVICVPSWKTRHIQTVALLFTFVDFLVSLFVWWRFDTELSKFEPVTLLAGVSQLELDLGIDKISMALIVLTTFLMPMCLVISWRVFPKRVQECSFTFLMLQTCILAVFCLPMDKQLSELLVLLFGKRISQDMYWLFFKRGFIVCLGSSDWKKFILCFFYVYIFVLSLLGCPKHASMKYIWRNFHLYIKVTEILITKPFVKHPWVLTLLLVFFSDVCVSHSTLYPFYSSSDTPAMLGTWIHRTLNVQLVGLLFFMYICIVLNFLWFTYVDSALNKFVWKRSILGTYLPKSVRSSESLVWVVQLQVSFISFAFWLYTCEYMVFSFFFFRDGSLSFGEEMALQRRLTVGDEHHYPLHRFAAFSSRSVNLFLRRLGLLKYW